MHLHYLRATTRLKVEAKTYSNITCVNMEVGHGYYEHLPKTMATPVRRYQVTEDKLKTMTACCVPGQL